MIDEDVLALDEAIARCIPTSLDALRIQALLLLGRLEMDPGSHSTEGLLARRIAGALGAEQILPSI